MRTFVCVLMLAAMLLPPPFALAQPPAAKKTNILIIWGDGVGCFARGTGATVPF